MSCTVVTEMYFSHWEKIICKGSKKEREKLLSIFASKLRRTISSLLGWQFMARCWWVALWSCRNVWKASRSESWVTSEYQSVSKDRESLWEIMSILCLPSLPKYSGIFSIIKVSKGKSQKEGGRETQKQRCRKRERLRERIGSEPEHKSHEKVRVMSWKEKKSLR